MSESLYASNSHFCKFTLDSAECGVHAMADASRSTEFSVQTSVVSSSVLSTQ